MFIVGDFVKFMNNFKDFVNLQTRNKNGLTQQI